MAPGTKQTRSDGASGIGVRPVPLLLIHGYPFDGTMWTPVENILTQAQIPTLTPNVPGFGGSKPLSGEPNLEAVADFLVEILDRGNIKRAVVAGMSMGGYIALALAERHPDRVAGLGLISTSTEADSEEKREGRRKLIATLAKEEPQAAATAIIPKMFSPEFVTNRGMTSIVDKGARAAGKAGLCWALEAMARRPDRGHVLDEITAPVLIMHGEKDDLIPLKAARLMADLAENEKYVEIPGAGHATPLETPEAVANGLKELYKTALENVR